MAPVAILLPLLTYLGGALAAPTPASPTALTPALQERYYYGDALGLARPAALPEKRALNLPAGWSYSGCVAESNGERLLQGFAFSSKRNSPNFCIDECAKRGFDVAGTEYGDECYCAKSMSGNGGSTAPDAWCNHPCPGDRGVMCGTAWYLSLYTYNSTAAGSLVCQGGQLVAKPVDPPKSSSSALPSSTATSSTLSTTAKSSTLSTTAKSSTALAPSSSTAASPSTTAKPSSSTAPAPSSTSPAPSNPSATGVVVPVDINVPPSDDHHQVWAHHMVGNTYSYSQNDWAADIAAAANQAIDGFALNVGVEGWQRTQVQSAYRAAEAHGNFKLFLSLDMTSLACSSANHATSLVNFVKQHASSSAQAKYNGLVLVSTFSGSDCTFGTGTNHGWQTAFVDPLKAGGLDISFIPSVFTNPNQFSKHTWMDGEFNWNSAWPMGNFDIGSDKTETSYRVALGDKAYMTAVSPYFFTHFGANSWNKNWIYRSDNWLYCTRWEQIIAMRTVSTMTEILTWNDYGESSYIGPIKGNLPPTSNTWVNGFDHSGLAPITKYYATAFKTGAYPAVEKDQIILWARPHAAHAKAHSDPVGRPTGFAWTEDNLYAVVLAKSPAVVTLSSGNTHMSFSVPAGLSKLKMLLAAGSIGGSIERNGQTVASYSAGSKYSFTNSPARYNYNYFVGSSS